MKSETKIKIKGFYSKYRTEIIVTGVVILGVILVRSSKQNIREIIKETEIIPEWAKKWRMKCDTEDLLYESGLPIFANPEKTIIYKDAFANEEAMREYIEHGYRVINRY